MVSRQTALAVCMFFFVALFAAVSQAAGGQEAVAARGGGAPAGDGQAANQEEDSQEEDDAEDGSAAGLAEPGENAWQAIWSGQREMLNEMRGTALKLSDSFSEQTENLSRHLRPFDEEGRRLLVFANTFKGHPNALEAVNRRITATIAGLDQVLEPVTMARAEAEGLLSRVNYMASSLPDDVDKDRLSPEMRAYVDDITRARLRLTAVLAQYDSLLPSLGLVRRLESARRDIEAQLPALWKDYYLQKPLAWLSAASWENMGQSLYYVWQATVMRLPVELPVTPPQWGTALLRFLIGLLFSGVLAILFRQRWLKRHSGEASAKIFNTAIPWLCLGFAFLGGSMSASGDFFRYFLSVGCLSLIYGEIHLAWALRLFQFPEQAPARPPFLRLMPVAILAFVLFYLPLTQTLALILWIGILLFRIHRGGQPARETVPDAAQLENGALECHTLVLWLCLFLAISGLRLYSVGVYLAYVSVSLALELSLGGMAVVSRINEHLPQEGARAVLARLIVALAAPFVLVLAVAGVCLWVAVLPGGTYLLGEYALKGVTVGATQFNVIQALLIISVFYLTRTVVAMGTRFLTKLPQQGLHFDATLVTPMQTALTYAAWAVFGLFVLRALGMELSSLAMVAGGLSVGIGFGMQTIVNNFLSGLILIFGRTLQVGDVVEVGGITGRVRKISVRATMVETYDNAVIYVPNSEFMAGRLINWTGFSRSVRREVQVGVAYGSDTARAMQLLVSIARAHENVLKYPAPNVNFADFAASSLDFRLRFWVKDYELGAATSSDIRLAIEKAFKEENIEIAFPQLDVHLKGMPKAGLQAGAGGGPGPGRRMPARRKGRLVRLQRGGAIRE